MRLLVTGASGFVGAAVCAELLRREHEVVALVRRVGSEPAGTRAVAGDLGDRAGLDRALADALPDCVVHLAAEIATQRDPRRIHDVNVEGTRRLLDAVAAAGGARVLFVSTVVTGDAVGATLTERTPLPVQTDYGRSKQEGERLVLDSGLDAVVLRPSHVYGPGGWYAQEVVGRLRQPGRFAVVGKGANWWDVVHMADVAVACAEAAERAPAGAVYHVVDDEPIVYRDFVGLTARALGVGPPRRIPAWLARRVAGAGPVQAVLRSAVSSNARIKQELGWQPRYPSARVGVPAAVAALASSSH